MFFSEHRLKIASLRIGKHRIVKNIASLRKVNIAHPYTNEAVKVAKEVAKVTKKVTIVTKEVDKITKQVTMPS